MLQPQGALQMNSASAIASISDTHIQHLPLDPGHPIELSLKQQKQDDQIWMESGALGVVKSPCFGGYLNVFNPFLANLTSSCPSTSLTTSWKPTSWDGVHSFSL